MLLVKLNKFLGAERPCLFCIKLQVKQKNCKSKIHVSNNWYEAYNLYIQVTKNIKIAKVRFVCTIIGRSI